MTGLSLNLLGAPLVALTGRPLRFPTRKSQALLIYLAVEGGRHAREPLIALFWPESDDRHGRAALRNTLARLRAVLAPAWAGATRPAGQLLADGDQLSFDPAPGLTLDLAQVDEALERLRAGAADLGALLPVRDLCRGEFLAGFSPDGAPAFDDWASVQRERWHQRVEAFLDQLSQLQMEAGQASGAVETAQRWVVHAPLSEAAARRLMHGLFTLGDREAALRAYQTICATLQAELGAEPSPETQALLLRLRGPAPTPPATQRAPARQAKLAALEAPLVGRAAPLAQIIASYHAAEQGQPQAVVVQGEAGIGKSRLSEEFLRWAAVQGAVALAGRAFEAGGRLPYQALVEALRPRLVEADLVRQAGERRAALLGRLLPELRDRFPSLPAPPGDDQDARAQLFEAVAYVVQSTAGEAPLVLYLDDLQWADTATLDLLRHLARRWAEPPGRPALLVLTVRSDALALSPDLAAWLAAVSRDLPLTRLSLGPLRAADTAEWLAALIGAPVDAGFLRWLHADTEGQPFYLVETLKVLVEQGVLSPTGGEPGRWRLNPSSADGESFAGILASSGRMPAGVREVIRARLAQLRAASTALLGAAAVLGHHFDFETLVHVAGQSDAVGLRALDDLLSRGLLVERADPARPYLFAHDKIRDVAYTECGAARRRVFHRRAFEALEQAGAPAAELSHHALAAGLDRAAFQWSVAAGDEALRLFASREAAAHYQEAAQVLKHHARFAATLEFEQRAHLYRQLGRACELLNDWAQARAAYEALLDLACAARDTAQQCLALNRLATLAAWNTFDMALADRLLAEAKELAERSGDRAGLAETEWNLAQLGIYRARPESLGHARQALALARELDRPELVARALNAVAHAAMGTAHWHELQAAAEEATTLYRQLGNRALEADSLALVAVALSNRGQLRAGLAQARAAYAISQSIDNAWGQVFSAFQLSVMLADLGEYEEAFSLARRYREVAAGLGFPNLSFLNLMSLALLELLVGRFEQSQAHLAAARALNEAAGNLPSYQEVVALLSCVLLGSQGRWDEALAPAQEAAACHDETYLLSPGLPAWTAVEALGRGGQRQAALAYSESFCRRAGQSPRSDLAQEQILAALARTRGDRDEALAHLALAADQAERLGLPGEQWLIAAQQSALYARAGDPAQAAAAAERATQVRRGLAERLTDPQLRAAWLAANRPFV